MIRYDIVGDDLWTPCFPCMMTSFRKRLKRFTSKQLFHQNYYYYIGTWIDRKWTGDTVFRQKKKKKTYFKRNKKTTVINLRLWGLDIVSILRVVCYDILLVLFLACANGKDEQWMSIIMNDYIFIRRY